MPALARWRALAGASSRSPGRRRAAAVPVVAPGGATTSLTSSAYLDTDVVVYVFDEDEPDMPAPAVDGVIVAAAVVGRL